MSPSRTTKDGGEEEKEDGEAEVEAGAGPKPKPALTKQPHPRTYKYTPSQGSPQRGYKRLNVCLKWLNNPDGIRTLERFAMKQLRYFKKNLPQSQESTELKDKIKAWMEHKKIHGRLNNNPSLLKGRDQEGGRKHNGFLPLDMALLAYAHTRGYEKCD